MARTAYDILKDSQLVEVALQEAAQRIWKNLHKINEINCQKTRNFSVIIIRHICFDMLRAECAADELSEDVADKYTAEDIAVEKRISRGMEILREKLRKGGLADGR